MSRMILIWLPAVFLAFCSMAWSQSSPPTNTESDTNSLLHQWEHDSEVCHCQACQSKSQSEAPQLMEPLLDPAMQPASVPSRLVPLRPAPLGVEIRGTAKLLMSRLNEPNLTEKQRLELVQTNLQVIARQARLEAELKMLRRQIELEQQISDLRIQLATSPAITDRVDHLYAMVQSMYEAQHWQGQQIKQMIAMNIAVPVPDANGSASMPATVIDPEVSGMVKSVPTDPASNTVPNPTATFARGESLMVWDPVHGIQLRPLKPVDPEPAAGAVRLADYKAELDVELVDLYRQMEGLENRIRELKSRHSNTMENPQSLRPMYRPEQPLRPLPGETSR